MNQELTKLWKVRRTVFQMCRDRSYLVMQEELDTTLEQFAGQFAHRKRDIRQAMTLLVAGCDDPARQMFVFFDDGDKLTLARLRTYVNRMQAENVQRSMVVCSGEATYQTKDLLRDASCPFVVESFTEAELLCNPTESRYVPEHIVLSPEEKGELLRRYKIKEFQLPRILTSDPIARYYGLRRGQVVKIVRASQTSGRYVNYRVAV